MYNLDVQVTYAFIQNLQLQLCKAAAKAMQVLGLLQGQKTVLKSGGGQAMWSGSKLQSVLK